MIESRKKQHRLGLHTEIQMGYQWTNGKGDMMEYGSGREWQAHGRVNNKGGDITWSRHVA